MERVLVVSTVDGRSDQYMVNTADGHWDAGVDESGALIIWLDGQITRAAYAPGFWAEYKVLPMSNPKVLNEDNND